MDLKLTSNEQTSEQNIVENENITNYDDHLSSKPISEIVQKNVKNRKRRNYSAAKREVTPVRYFEEISSDEINKEESDNEEKHIEYVSGKKIANTRQIQPSNSQGSFKKTRENGLSTHTKTESISELAQNELVSLFNKTKKSITSAAIRGRERFRKYEQQLAKRSQSAPQQFIEELQESLKRVEPLQTDIIQKRKYSDSSLNLSCDSKFTISTRHRRSLSKSLTSPKIIEILDPKTSTVLSRKTVTNLNESKEACLRPLAIVTFLDIYYNYKLHKIQCKKEYDNIKRILRKCACELFLIMVYCGFGGLLFKFTEGTFETFYKCGVRRVKRDFVDMLWTKSHNLREDDWKSLARNKLRSFEEELHNAHEAGMTDYSGQRSWSFLNGIVYSLTIITTIGYGHMYPKTHTGRALSIVYALIGIPLFLIALTDFGKLFTRCIKFFWSFVRRLYYTGSCRRARKTAAAGDIFKGAQMFYDIATFRRPSTVPNAQSPTESDSQPATTDTPTTPAISNFEIDDEFNLPISVALFILVAYIICGAVMYMLIERWEFFEAFYFVFISMSTIGFGDYVPRDPVFMIGSIIYLVFGLALMSMCINVVQAKISDTFKEASAKIGATMGLEVDEDGSIITATPENVDIIVPIFVTSSNELSNKEK